MADQVQLDKKIGFAFLFVVVANVFGMIRLPSLILDIWTWNLWADLAFIGSMLGIYFLATSRRNFFWLTPLLVWLGYTLSILFWQGVDDDFFAFRPTFFDDPAYMAFSVGWPGMIATTAITFFVGRHVKPTPELDLQARYGVEEE